MEGLEGRVALVTGAAQGTGASIARRLVELGSRVILGDVLQVLSSFQLIDSLNTDTKPPILRYADSATVHSHALIPSLHGRG